MKKTTLLLVIIYLIFTSINTSICRGNSRQQIVQNNQNEISENDTALIDTLYLGLINKQKQFKDGIILNCHLSGKMNDSIDHIIRLKLPIMNNSNYNFKFIKVAISNMPAIYYGNCKVGLNSNKYDFLVFKYGIKYINNSKFIYISGFITLENIENKKKYQLPIFIRMMIQ